MSVLRFQHVGAEHTGSLALAMLGQMPNQFPILVILGFRQDHTLTGDQLRSRGTASRLGHFYRGDQ